MDILPAITQSVKVARVFPLDSVNRVRFSLESPLARLGDCILARNHSQELTAGEIVRKDEHDGVAVYTALAANTQALQASLALHQIEGWALAVVGRIYIETDAAHHAALAEDDNTRIG